MVVTWKDEDAVQHFVGNRRHLPCFDWLFDAAVALVRDVGHRPGNIVDLGCGSGVTGGAMRVLWPEARLTLVDNSPAMLELARRDYGDAPGVRIIDADLGVPGTMERVSHEPVDVVVSSAAIHHLPRSRQHELYGEILDALEPGGVFVNIEHTASCSDRTERIWWEWLYAKVLESRRAQGDPVSLDAIRREFEARQEINILTPVSEQADWLRQIGFVDVDCVFKVFEMAVFGGYKPG